MSFQENSYALAKFGIDEIYIHDGLPPILLEKLHQRAVLSLDSEDNIVLKYAAHDMILVFRNSVPTPSLIYRFLKFLHEFPGKDDFIESNTLINEDELFAAIKSKEFVLVTPKILLKNTHLPSNA